MKLHYAFLAMAAAVVPLHATGITLDFEGLLDSESINNYYNGGEGGFNSGPGVNYGVTFSPDATAFIQTLVSDGQGGYVPGGTQAHPASGLFGGEPSAQTAMMFCVGYASCGSGQTSETIDLAGGFNTGFSLYYTNDFYSGLSDPQNPGSFTIYSGLDGTGQALATATLGYTTTLNGNADDGFSNPDPCTTYGAASDPGAPACPFVQLSTTFTGTAQSVVFTGATDLMFFDNVTFAATGQSAAPEPGTWILFGAGLAGILVDRRVRAVRA